MKSKGTFINIVTALLLQAVLMLEGFIVPRIILVYFGSDTNGLITSLSQFLSYISLLEGGIEGVALAKLYKPLVQKDYQKVSSLLVTLNSFYKRIGLIYMAYTVIVGLLYPLLKASTETPASIFLLTVVLSGKLLVQYLFSLTLKNLLFADKKNYIVSITQIIITVLNIGLVMAVVRIKTEIHLVKGIVAFLYLLQPIVYNYYVRRHYEIDWNSKKDNNLIKERWAGFSINLAAFIHMCTDVVVLTLFSDLKNVSVYSVYYLAVSGLRSLIVAFTSSIQPVLGHAYASGDREELNSKLNMYEFIMVSVVLWTFSVCTLLLTPFVKLYTHGVTDADYFQPVFGYILTIAEAFYLLKFPHMHLAYVSNSFRQITPAAYIEAGLNIVISLILVNYWGMIGVATGTFCAMIFRLIYHVWFTKTIIPTRKAFIYYKKLFTMGVPIIAGTILCNKYIPCYGASIAEWCLKACLYAALLGGILLLCSLIFYRKEIGELRSYIKR